MISLEQKTYMFKQEHFVSLLVGVRVRMFLSVSFNNCQFIVVIWTFNNFFWVWSFFRFFFKILCITKILPESSFLLHFALFSSFRWEERRLNLSQLRTVRNVDFPVPKVSAIDFFFFFFWSMIWHSNNNNTNILWDRLAL